MTDQHALIGQTYSHYRIVEKIGGGGMGVVYKAHDLQLRRDVALKFLPSDLALNSRDKENLLREARAASSLDHLNIGSIYGLEETPDHQLFIIMAYYEGETLASVISRGLSTLSESLELLIQIARGLASAHAHNIVHRDVKPTNIIITKEHIVKIVDFGLARVVASTTMTQSLLTSGTLPFMAPEQVLGESISPRCDVWALGVVLVQLLTGEHPFFRDNTAAMTFAILNQAPTALDKLPPAIRPIAYKALAKQPENRYPSGKEILEDLEAVRQQVASSESTAGMEADTLTSVVPPKELRKVISHASTPRWASPASQPIASNRGLYITFGVVALALLSLLLPSVRERLSTLLAAGRENHIAVLPFDTLGDDPSNEALAQGLMESMTSELSNLSSVQQTLWVVPASVVRSRKITDPSAAARELGATVVVKGNIRRSGQAVHLTVDLIDTKNLRQVGSVSLEDQAGDIASLQTEAVARLARLMNIKVSADMLRATGGTVAPAAYESYLQALGLMQRYDKPGNLDKAIDTLNTAVQTDPRFALGYAQLGEAFRLKYQVEVNPKWLTEAKANCQKAVVLDDRVPAVYVTLGRLHETLGEHDLAVQEFQRALALDQRNASALSGLAHSHESAGRIAEAEATYKQAAALRPDYWDGYDELGLFYDRQARYPEAIENLKRAIQLTPDNAQVYSNLGAIYLDTGDAKFRSDAEQALKKSIELNPSYPAYANLGSLYYDTGRYAEAATTYQKALQLNSENYLVWQWLMNSYEWLGQKDKAAQALDQSFTLASREAQLRPRDPSPQAVLATFYAKKGNPDKARNCLETALALAPDAPDILEYAASVSENIGERARAIQFAHKALQKGYPLSKLHSDPDIQGMLKDPSFHPDGN
jgi:serine/threonine protein kinase/tetratricopeptide (TPR) repeat protein